jgi:hypothetical protein
MFARALVVLLVGASLAACGDAAVSRSLAPAAEPSFSNGNKTGQCFYELGLDGIQVDPGADGNATATAPNGNVVSRIAVKAGPTCAFTPETVTGIYTIGGEGAPCYVVSGIGSETVTVTRVGSGPVCKDISHIEFIAAPQPTTGSLQICAVLSGTLPPNLQLAPFRFEVAGVDVVVASGACSNPIELPSGAFVITESPSASAIGLWNAATMPEDRLIGFVATQSATVMVVAGSTTVATITSVFVPPDPGPDF